MASNTPKPELTPEERAYWESILALAEPYAAVVQELCRRYGLPFKFESWASLEEV